MDSRYVGTELDLFANAINWKAYWSGLLRPYLGKRVLDVGAGIGSTAKIYSDVEFDSYLALEPDSALAARIQQASGSMPFPDNFRVQTGTTIDLPTRSEFDTILYIDVLEHIHDDGTELARASAHLAPHGRIIVLSPAHQWLYSEFDQAIGHVRRYSRSSLLAAKPDSLVVERVFYLDCVGLLASLGNRLLLKASNPSERQIGFWDGVMVPISAKLDRLIGFRAGKTIVAVYRQQEPALRKR